MGFLANYWWLLALPVVLILWVWSIRRTSRSQWVFILRFTGVASLLGTALWLVTGDIESQYASLHIGGGWRGVTLGLGYGLLALFGAQRIAARRGPPA